MVLKRSSTAYSRGLCATAVVATLSQFVSKGRGQSIVTYTGLDLDIQDNSLLTAIGLNSSDQVVGYTTSGSTQLPFVYTPHGSGTGFTTIPGIPSNGGSEATGINNAGVVVGNDGVSGKGFVYTVGASSATEVAPIAGNTLTFSGVNNNGIAVGTSSTAAGGNTIITYNISSGSKTDVGTGFTGSASSSYSSYASAINDNNTVLGIGLQSSPTNSYPAHFQPFTAATTAGGYSYTNVGNAVEAVIPESGTNPYPGYLPTEGLSLNGDVAGTTYAAQVGTYKPQFESDAGGYLYNGGTGAVTNIGYTAQSNAVADVNGVAESVGTVFTENYTGAGGGYVHGFDAYTYTAAGGMINLYNAVPHYTLSNVIAINSAGDILAEGSLNGDSTNRYLLLTVNTSPNVIYTGAVSNSWNTTTANFTPSNYADGDFVTFNDAATGSTTVNIPSSIIPNGVIFNNSSKSYVITGASIGGSSTTLTMQGTGSVTLDNLNTFAGETNVGSGSLIIGSTGSLASGIINLGKNSSVTVQSGGAVTSTALNLIFDTGSSFTIAPTTPNKVVLQLASIAAIGGPLDVGNTDLIFHNYSSGVTGTSSIIATGYANGTWQGSYGILSSAAKNDTTHLTTLGTIQNSDDQTPTGAALYKTFDGIPVADTDTLVKYTYYGDTDLNGVVDGTDYSRIDTAYEANLDGFYPVTGWFNGDFNYDGVIDGSDYTLMDNAFNQQSTPFSGAVPAAIPTALIAGDSGTVAVPEPAMLGLLGMSLLGRRKRRPR